MPYLSQLLQKFAIPLIFFVILGRVGLQAEARSDSIKVIREGTSIELNGRTLHGAWAQWQDSDSSEGLEVGIADLSLRQFMGLELLNTNNSTQQPIQWFSPASTSSERLVSLHQAPYRYLNFKKFAQAANWQITVQGTTLKVITPPATITQIQQKPLSRLPAAFVSDELRSAARRIVVQLDHPTPWQFPTLLPSNSRTAKTQPNSPKTQEWGITIEGTIAPTITSNFQPILDPPLQQLHLNQDPPNSTRLRFNVPVGWRPVVSSLGDPTRLEIEIRPDFLVERDILWAPGLRWRQQYIAIPNPNHNPEIRFPVVWLEVDLNQPQISLTPLVSRTASRVGLAPLLKTANRSQATAAINGGFFNRNTLFPLGALRRQGDWLSSPILNRGAIAWNGQGQIQMDRLKLKETLITPTGERFPLVHLNSGYIAVGISRYTPEWGLTYLPVTSGELIIAVENHKVIYHTSANRRIPIPIIIPRNGYLLVARDRPELADHVPVGSVLDLENQLEPPAFDSFPQIVAAGPLLLKQGEIVLDAGLEGFSEAFGTQEAVRSAIGITASNHLLLVTVHHRPGGLGPTLAELAHLMQELGAIDALNLDGGSSTSLYLGGQLLDRLPQTAAPVHNGLGVFLQD